MTNHPSIGAEAAMYDGWRHTPGATFAAQQAKLTAQFTRQCDPITAPQRAGRITSAEAAGPTELRDPVAERAPAAAAQVRGHHQAACRGQDPGRQSRTCL